MIVELRRLAFSPRPTNTPEVPSHAIEMKRTLSGSRGKLSEEKQRIIKQWRAAFCIEKTLSARLSGPTAQEPCCRCRYRCCPLKPLASLFSCQTFVVCFCLSLRSFILPAFVPDEEDDVEVEDGLSAALALWLGFCRAPNSDFHLI